MKVRITQQPRELELDGIRLDGFIPGMVREVSPLIATWLIMQGYAVAEMRRTWDEDQWFGRRVKSFPQARPRRRRAERRVAY